VRAGLGVAAGHGLGEALGGVRVRECFAHPSK
jgi:hypothetical protein